MSDEQTEEHPTTAEIILETLKELQGFSDGQLRYLAYLLAQIPGINP